MRRFSAREVKEALAYAAEGGQALHCHQIIVDWKKAPRCFRRAVKAGKDIAHLFDTDLDRLIETGRELGVQQIVVEHRGTPRQHIDLCGLPLQRAKELAAGSLF